ncbi:hypothetical protein GDO78_005840 [Eleutherodactylus coqui]|uniref:Uncharacterized protein n=1 Tax=Eleutherodactylus coqui TaxID=57060 RepID=A0A8J6FP14_ELECQ|nr:hypothetical protein GDO78_005840 [Eleutherodactylus coqui]
MMSMYLILGENLFYFCQFCGLKAPTEVYRLLEIQMHQYLHTYLHLVISFSIRQKMYPWFIYTSTADANVIVCEIMLHTAESADY